MQHTIAIFNEVIIMSRYIYRKTFDWIIALLKESLANGELYQSREEIWDWFDRTVMILYELPPA